jgi:hypothetical protein
MSKQLIALVATAVMVDGSRTIVQPGEVLPDLGKHDAAELLRTGMAQDATAAEAQAKADKKAEALTKREFQEARERVLAAQVPAESAPPIYPTQITGAHHHGISKQLRPPV